MNKYFKILVAFLLVVNTGFAKDKIGVYDLRYNQESCPNFFFYIPRNI